MTLYLKHTVKNNENQRKITMKLVLLNRVYEPLTRIADYLTDLRTGNGRWQFLIDWFDNDIDSCKVRSQLLL